MIKSTKSIFILATVSVILLGSSVYSIDPQGRKVYTRMELNEILENWCNKKPWIMSAMKRYSSCRDASLVSTKYDQKIINSNQFILYF